MQYAAFVLVGDSSPIFTASAIKRQIESLSLTIFKNISSLPNRD